MKFSLKSAVAAAAAIAIAGAGVVAGAGSASAYTGTPPWEPDPGSLGSLSFYDATGAQIYGGTNLAHIADYVQASTAGRAGSNKATLYFAVPDHTKVPAQWAASSASASTNFPAAAAPAPVNGFTNPVGSPGAADANLVNLLATATLDTTAQYAQVIQVRLKDSGIGVPLLSTYWSADIEYNPSSATAAFDGLAPGSWKVVYPAPPVITATSVTTPVATPASPVASGTSITLSSTASETATPANYPAGSIQFKDGATNVGAAIAVSAAGVATTPTFVPADGVHSFTAVFTPTAAGFSASSSTALAFTVTAPAHNTNTVLGAFTGVDGTGSIAQPAVLGGSAIVTDTTAAGSPVVTVGQVAFLDGATVFATDTNGADGFSFSVASTVLSVGVHSTIHAVYTDGALFNTSSSGNGTVTVTAPTYAADPQYIETSIGAGTLVISTPYTLSNPLVLPVMTLNATSTLYSTSAPFNGITVTDTRAGNLPYTLSALSSTLTVGGVAQVDPNKIISAQNVGLTGLSLVSSNATPNTFGAAGNLVPFDNTAAVGVASGASGSLGLGGAAAHSVLHAGAGLGTTVVNGLLSITAPTNTLAGTYKGIVTFTILGV